VRRFAIVVTVVASARIAHGNPAAIVPTAGGANLTFDYDYEQDKATIARESIGDPGQDPLSPIVAHKDLVFHQFQHTVTPKLDVGIYHDTWLSVALPIVIAQQRELQLDSGVDRAHSSTLADGYLPSAGYDATANGGALTGDDVFRGVTRHGIDQIHLGIGTALMNQARDPTKPTWKLGAEVRLAVGSVMAIDPTSPGSNTAVGRGVHEVRLWTSFDKKIGWAEPHAELFWQAPIGVTSSSPFQDPGFGSTNVGLGQQAGVSFGFEAAAVDDNTTPGAHNRISLDLGSRIVAHFEGRDYSEMWETFALAGNKDNPANPLILDSDPVTPGVQAESHPGITNVENYLEMTANATLRGEIGTHVRLALSGEVIVKTDHAITFADSGVDLPTCSATVTANCETANNDVVNPGTREVNPAYVPAIDLVGHRYRSENDLGFVLGLQAQFLF
jgi:hypothetical protein